MVTDNQIINWLKEHPKTKVVCESVGFTMSASALATGYKPSVYTICGVPLEAIVGASLEYKNANGNTEV